MIRADKEDRPRSAAEKQVRSDQAGAWLSTGISHCCKCPNPPGLCIVSTRGWAKLFQGQGRTLHQLLLPAVLQMVPVNDGSP